MTHGSSRSDRDSDDRDDLVDVLVRLMESEKLPTTQDGSRGQLVRSFLDAVTGSGFEIRRLDSTTDPRLDQPSESESADLPSELDLGESLRFRELMSLWRRMSDRSSSGRPVNYIEVADRVLKAGQPLIAYDIVRTGLGHWPDNLRLRQLRALALARSGAAGRARKILKTLVEEGHEDTETLSLLARTNKDLWSTETEPGKRTKRLQESHDLYRQGYDNAVDSGSIDDAIYAGVNAATTGLLLGDQELAARLAGQVSHACRRKLDDRPDYWALATLGECELIQDRPAKAEDHYAEAARLAGRNFADIASTKRNAELLLRHQGKADFDLADWFPVPKVAVFTGHLIDRPGGRTRFPESQIGQVYEEIKCVLAQVGAAFGFASAASGGDLLFLKAMEEIGGESHIVLPLPRQPFIEASVDVEGGHDWVADFDRMIEAASKLTVANEFSRSAQPEHFDYANHFMTGLAMLQSRTLGTEIVPIALWDERPAKGAGGSGTVVEYWRSLGWEPRVINPLKLAGTAATHVDRDRKSDATPSSNEETSEIEVRAMLFADVVGYSKLSEEEIPLFVRDFMGGISECVKKCGVTIETFNTWGDAIYFVFRDVRDAGVTALAITRHVNSIDWQERGFIAPMTLRIGLHVGPVFRVVDPVTKTATHTGAHVSRAARIEPIAPPGEVYASEAFAAVAAADEVSEFVCEYVGVTPMAKGYGEFATYHVTRRNDAV